MSILSEEGIKILEKKYRIVPGKEFVTSDITTGAYDL
jgi:hypothetical protein